MTIHEVRRKLRRSAALAMLNALLVLPATVLAGDARVGAKTLRSTPFATSNYGPGVISGRATLVRDAGIGTTSVVVLTDPKRLMLIDAMRPGERSVGELAGAVGLSLANVSQHLAVLRHAGLVDTRRAGTSIHYRLSEPELVAVCDIIERLVRRRLHTSESGG